MVGGDTEIRDGHGRGRLLAAITAACLLACAAAPGAALAAPTLTIDKPQNGGYLASGTVTIAGSTDAPAGTVTVSIHAGSSAAGGLVEEPIPTIPDEGGGWSVTTALPDGEYTAVAQQSEGEETVSSEVTFTVDTVAPNVTMFPVPTPSSDSTPTLEGEAGVTEGDDGSVTVTIYKGKAVGGEVAVKQSVARLGSGWTLTSPHLSDGTYTAQVTQRDAAGNVGESEARTFAIKTVAPTVTLETPADGAVLTNSQPSFSGGAGNASGDSATVTVDIYRGTSASGTPAVVLDAPRSGSTWNATPPESLEDATYTAQAHQEDETGNVGTSAAHTFEMKRESPVVTLNPMPAVSTNATPEFSGEADTREGNSPQITLKIYSGELPIGSPLRTLHAEESEGTWKIGPVAALGDGTYTAQAEQPDDAGHTGQSLPVTFTIDAAPPKPTLTPLAKRINNPTPTLQGTRSTEPLDEAAITVTVYEGSAVGGGVVGSPQTFSVSGASWSYSVPHLNDGTYTAQASQRNAAGVIGTSAPATFTVDTVAPSVTLAPLPALSNDATPTLEGAAGTEVGDGSRLTVTVFEGVTTSGPVAASGSTSGAGGHWSYTSARLNDGTYTAQASEVDEAGNVGASEARTFTIDTASPKVTLNAPALLSNNTKPKFTGTANDTTTVTVSIYSKASGALKATATASGTGGGWESSEAQPALADGQYTAIATQPSSLGNPEGKSASVTFTVSTAAPTVTINPPPSPSNNRRPSFTGTASDVTPVTIKIYEGEGTGGKLLATASASGTGGAWTSGPASAELPAGNHVFTATATQASSIPGNPEGTSAPVTFVVDTNAPTLTLTSPKTPSNNTSPTFTGTASDTTTVTVSIYKGSTVGGSPFTTASAVPVAGAWTSGAPARALPEGTYSAVAKQPSSIGNEAGVSPSVKFVVDTKAPALSINPLSHQQFKTFPELSGTAGKEGGDLPTVLVKIYKGSVPGGQVAIEKSVAASGGAWSFASSTNLVDGPYTAVATESDEAGNVATSAPVTFTLDTEPPALTLEGPAQQQSNNTEPSFSGTTSDPTPITVDVYLLESGGKKRLYATAGATPAGGTWKSGALSQPLGQGHHTYTATATQTDEAANTASAGPTPPFVVDTQAPAVTLDPPRSPTNNTTPSFSGVASERTTVTIRIYNAGSGQLAAQTSAAGTGSSWTSGAATPALADGRYWVVASQESAFGNHAGETERTPLTVDTVSPHVTLEAPSSGSGTSEQVRGSADASDPDGYPTVTVQLYAGSAIAGSPMQSLTVPVSGGGWSATIGGLGAGTYTVRAERSDAAGNVAFSASGTFSLSGASGSPSRPPAASFTWVPAAPRAREPVSLVSNSTDATSPLTGFAWDLAGNGPFASAGPILGTSFAAPGNHVVRLRVTDANGLTSVVTETIPVGPPAFVLMRPFPIVRILATRSGRGVRLTLLSILATRGSKITISCKGHGCPMRRQSRIATARKVGLASVSFARFQRTLRAGTVLEIRVWKTGQVGKYTRLSVLHGRLHRIDSCLSPAGVNPMRCPS